MAAKKATKKKTYRCSICNKPFPHPGKVAGHILKAHPGQRGKSPSNVQKIELDKRNGKMATIRRAKVAQPAGRRPTGAEGILAKMQKNREKVRELDAEFHAMKRLL